ncbi:plasmid recombination protein [Vibrio splendidus]|uniref:plasmid recombination protein n=1 Tax=Vibrio splendidus TaxID=29497 RepID=UPI00076A9D3F|nr:plasmid recombination protein [Vibrio splendidus]
MSGFQFFHIEPYSFEASKDHKYQGARNMAAEADRFALACPHVKHLKKPIRLYGCSANEAVDEAEKIIKTATDRLGRKIRKDANIILTGVASYPTPIEELTPSDENLKKWIKLNLDFLRKKYGKHFKSAIAHIDEAYFHIHIYILPEVDSNNILSFSSIHDGIRARESVSKLGAKAKMRAYTDAMRSLQDEYYQHVGIPCGLTREGPKRRRLSRKEWVHEQRVAERLAKAESRIEQIRSAAKKVKLVEMSSRLGTTSKLNPIESIDLTKNDDFSNTYNN